MDIVDQIMQAYGFTAEEIFNQSFPGVNHFIVENYLSAYEDRGTIPAQVKIWCREEQERHEV